MMRVLEGVTALDHDGYVERRLRDADDAEAQVDALVAQTARRFMAIRQAVKDLRSVEQQNRSCNLTHASLSEQIEEIVRALETANQVRATDTEASL